MDQIFFYNGKGLEIKFCVQQENSGLKTSERPLKNSFTGRNISKVTALSDICHTQKRIERLPEFLWVFFNLYFLFYYVLTRINICNNNKREKPLLKRESKIVKLWRKSKRMSQKYFDYQVSKWRANDKGSWRQKYLPLRKKHFSKDNIRVLGEKKGKKKKSLQIDY